NPSLESKCVFGELQIHAVVIRPDGRHPGDDHAEIAPRERLDRRLAECEHRVDRGNVLDARGARDRGEIRDAAGRMRLEPAGRQQAAVVEDEEHQVTRPLARERREHAEVHQHRPVAVEHDDRLARQVHREAEPDRRGEPHRMLQIEEVLAMPEIVQLLRARAHDRDDGLVLEIRVEHADALGALHSGSSIRSRVSSSATGDSELCENVYASRIWRLTWVGSRAYSNGMFSARSTPSVTMPPRVCHGYGSPQWPRRAT